MWSFLWELWGLLNIFTAAVIIFFFLYTQQQQQEEKQHSSVCVCVMMPMLQLSGHNQAPKTDGCHREEASSLPTIFGLLSHLFFLFLFFAWGLYKKIVVLLLPTPRRPGRCVLSFRLLLRSASFMSHHCLFVHCVDHHHHSLWKCRESLSVLISSDKTMIHLNDAKVPVCVCGLQSCVISLYYVI